MGSGIVTAMADVPSAAQKARALRRIAQIEKHTKAYRTSMLRIFSAKLSRPRDCRKYFREVLLAVCRLYVDYLLVAEDLLTLRRCSRSRGLGSAPGWSPLCWRPRRRLDGHGRSKRQS